MERCVQKNLKKTNKPQIAFNIYNSSIQYMYVCGVSGSGMWRPFSTLCPLRCFFCMAFNAPTTHKCPGMRLFWYKHQSSTSDRKHRAPEVNRWPRGQKACKLIELCASLKTWLNNSWHTCRVSHVRPPRQRPENTRETRALVETHMCAQHSTETRVHIEIMLKNTCIHVCFCTF